MRLGDYRRAVAAAVPVLILLAAVLVVPVRAEERRGPAQPPAIGADREPGSPVPGPNATPDDDDEAAVAPRGRGDTDEAPNLGPGFGQGGCPYRGRKLELIV